MKLLIITQVVDENHPVLGFFVGWIEAMSKKFTSVEVIALYVGSHSLPANVTVYSLGKEERKSKLAYLSNLVKHLRRLRGKYDGVFVHMNEEYLLLAGWYWQWLKVPVHLWRNHYSGSWKTNLAAKFCQKIYYTSQSSYTARFKQAVQMPIGIDTELFSFSESLRKKSALYVGRICTEKRVKKIVLGLQKYSLQREGKVLPLTLVGPSISKADSRYHSELLACATEWRVPIDDVGPVPYSELPAIYASHKVTVNSSRPGMFDKVIGESIACGTPIITTNSDMSGIPGVITIDSDGDLKSGIASALSRLPSLEEVKAGREYVISNHSLSELTNRIFTGYKGALVAKQS